MKIILCSLYRMKIRFPTSHQANSAYSGYSQDIYEALMSLRSGEKICCALYRMTIRFCLQWVVPSCSLYRMRIRLPPIPLGDLCLHLLVRNISEGLLSSRAGGHGSCAFFRMRIRLPLSHQANSAYSGFSWGTYTH